MSTKYKQEDYYTVAAIEARLSEALGSDSWANIKKTDLGQSLINMCANAVHMDAAAFFTGLNQMFRSTATIGGYMEELAKSRGVIPRTYISANVTISIFSKDNTRSYLPMDLCLKVGGKSFHNIGDTTIGTSSAPTTLVMYEGSVVREASEAGKMLGSSWSYTQFKAVLSEKVGDKVVRKYLILPKNVFIDSIVVESGLSWNVPFVRWNKVKSWYNVGQTARAWKLGKDLLGRYIIEFGDGVYGREYPTDEILGVRYILSGGSGVSVESLANGKLINQDVNDVTSAFTFTVSNVVDGQSEINISDLNLEIEAAENTRDALINEGDYKNYLESRSDVLYASVQAERHNNPPNIEYFNTMAYAIKPNAQGGSFNDAEIQTYLTKNGLKTVEFKNIAVATRKFNIKIGFSPKVGYTSSSIQSQIENIVGSDMAWSGLGFDETISEERIYSLIKDIEGLDVQTLTIRVEYIYTDKDTGETEFSFVNGTVLPLRFYPRRFRTYMASDALVTGTEARDNGEGSLYGDFANTEMFSLTGSGIYANNFQFGNLLALGQGTTTDLYLVDLRKSQGAVSFLRFLAPVVCSGWCDRYSEIITVELSGGSYYLRTYTFPDGFFEQDGYSYIQLKDRYTYKNYKKNISLARPIAGAVPACITYFDGYVYIAWTMPSGNNRLYRYRVMAGSLEIADTLYNGVGYIPLTTKACLSMVGISDPFGDGVSGLFITTATGGTTESCLDCVKNFDIADECIFEKDFFRSTLQTGRTLPLNWGTITTDGSNLYASLGTDVANTSSIVVKLYALNSDGTCTVKQLSDNTVSGIMGGVYSIYNAKAEVYYYSMDTKKLYNVGYDALNTAGTTRAGTGTSGTVSSITKIADIAYDMLELTFVVDITGTLRYESEAALIFEKEEMVVLNVLTVYGQ